MSKMAKFLATKKGKGSVKASADTALQAALAIPETDLAPDILDNLKNVTRAETDDWGADSDSEPPAGNSVVIGGHFHLISEEDVSKKQQRKPRKWGEVEKIEPPVAEAKPEENVVPVVQPPELKPYRLNVARQRMEKAIDVKNEQSFPGLDERCPKLTAGSSSAAAKKKEKKIEEKLVEKIAEKGNETDEESDTRGRNEKGSKGEPSLMLIDEFLLDVVKPNVNIIFNDETSKAKFVGRKKRPRVSLPTSEL